MTRQAQQFEFEGEMLTIAQIRQRVPILNDASLRAHIAAGRNTTQAILTHVPRKPKPNPRARTCMMFHQKRPG